MIVGADELVYLVHESGAVYAAAIRDDAIIAATEALDEDDALDPASLEDREYFDDVGAMLAQAYEGGAAAVITARFTVDAQVQANAAFLAIIALTAAHASQQVQLLTKYWQR